MTKHKKVLGRLVIGILLLLFIIPISDFIFNWTGD